MASNDIADEDWLTQDVSITKPLRLSDPQGDISSTSSSTSSLQLEVSRLAAVLKRVQAPVNITAVDYSSTRCRLSSNLHAGNLAAFLSEPVSERLCGRLG